MAGHYKNINFSFHDLVPSAKFIRVIYLSFLLYCIAVFLIYYIFLPDHWFFSFLYLSIPLILILNLLIVVLAAFVKWKPGLLSLVVLLLFIQEVRKTISLNFFQNESEVDISVATYNVSTFNYGRYNKVEDSLTPEHMLDWMTENLNTDILCLQEFYNDDFHSYESSLNRLSQAGLHNFYIHPVSLKSHSGFFGVILFSRYPILHSGELVYGSNSINRGIYADIKVQSDTVRILNIHLQSMTIRLDSSTSIFKPASLWKNTTTIISKLKDGFHKRNDQIKKVQEFVKNSPGKIIVCGDFNDVPYSYSYRKMSQVLSNSFEEQGCGFGFTYNKFPWFIRIDNQFYGEGFEAETFKVYNENKLSDHYPVEVGYSFK